MDLYNASTVSIAEKPGKVKGFGEKAAPCARRGSFERAEGERLLQFRVESGMLNVTKDENSGSGQSLFHSRTGMEALCPKIYKEGETL